MYPSPLQLILYEDTASFSVGADHDVEEGYYYIEWVIIGDTVSDTYQYTIPARTIIHVRDDIQGTVYFDEIPAIPLGGRSPSIKATLSYPPNTEL